MPPRTDHSSGEFRKPPPTPHREKHAKRTLRPARQDVGPTSKEASRFHRSHQRARPGVRFAQKRPRTGRRVLRRVLGHRLQTTIDHRVPTTGCIHPFFVSTITSTVIIRYSIYVYQRSPPMLRPFFPIDTHPPGHDWSNSKLAPTRPRGDRCAAAHDAAESTTT